MPNDALLKKINDRRCRHHFAGTEVFIPLVGDRVRIVRGENCGDEYEVLAVRGNVYIAAQRIYVNAPGDIPVWYYPWDVEVLPRDSA